MDDENDSRGYVVPKKDDLSVPSPGLAEGVGEQKRRLDGIVIIYGPMYPHPVKSPTPAQTCMKFPRKAIGGAAIYSSMPAPAWIA